jgi:hypothetical protein
MKVEEYRTIRDEMLLRFRWSHGLLLFAFASTGALLSWLSTRQNMESCPYFFICIGLGIIGFVFYAHKDLLHGIYNLGSYLAVFHEELEKPGWHWLSRFRDDLLGPRSMWGADGRRGAIILAILAVANIGGPVWLLSKDLNFWSPLDVLGLVTFMLAFPLSAMIAVIGWKLFHMADFMLGNMKKWKRIKKELERQPNLLKDTVSRVLDCGDSGC